MLDIPLTAFGLRPVPKPAEADPSLSKPLVAGQHPCGHCLGAIPVWLCDDSMTPSCRLSGCHPLHIHSSLGVPFNQPLPHHPVETQNSHGPPPLLRKALRPTAPQTRPHPVLTDNPPLTHPTLRLTLNLGWGLTPSRSPQPFILRRGPISTEMRHRDQSDSDITMRQTRHTSETKALVPATASAAFQLRPWQKPYEAPAIESQHLSDTLPPMYLLMSHCAKAASAMGMSQMSHSLATKTVFPDTNSVPSQLRRSHTSGQSSPMKTLSHIKPYIAGGQLCHPSSANLPWSPLQMQPSMGVTLCSAPKASYSIPTPQPTR